MYIPYEFFSNIAERLLKNKKFHNFFYRLKISQNLKYIEKNKLKVLNKLKRKLVKGEKLNAIFYVYDETKWKCQSVYDILSEDSRFNVKILVTKTACLNKNNSSYISDNDVERTYKFFTEKGMNVEYAYDIKKSKFIPLKKYNPDIIFYQHPWYVKTEQGPVVCSKFALTCYIPYYFPIETADIDCGLRFHQYVENYYVLDGYTKQKYLEKNPELKEKLKVVGYPYLDLYEKNNTQKAEEYYIYAPHWTLGEKGLAYGTFEWSGKFMLEYAKTHPEIKWIFKPHPLLYKALQDSGYMTKKEAEEYYSEWGKIGIRYESGEYLDIFRQSKMMITDCSSFLGEYFITTKPIIHLMSEKSQFRTSENPILKTYYRANNLEELKILLEKLPEQDDLKDFRVQTLKKTGLGESLSSKRIADNIINEILK